MNADKQGCTAADRHANPDSSHKGMVMWKNVLTGRWNGPDPVLVWVRDSVCVFTQDQQQPIWVPEWLSRVVQPEALRDENLEPVPVAVDAPSDTE